MKKAIWAGWLAVAGRAARAYVAGPHLEQAVGTCRWLASRGMACTVGYWNVAGDPPGEVAGAYLTSLDVLAREALDCYLSIKVPALKFDQGLLTAVLERGREADVRVHFDSLGPETADRTFALIDAARGRYPWLGCTLPSRWRRSVGDADWAVASALGVRVVKGQWEDPAGRLANVRGNYLAIVDRLAGRAKHVAIATHDIPLASEAVRRLRRAGTPCELELLYGLPAAPARRLATEAGVHVRMYVPYGHAFLPYCISQARENPHVFWWALRDTLLARNLYVWQARRFVKASGAAGNASCGS